MFENKRKIAVCGRSMINMISTAMELGYIDVPDNVFIDIDKMDYAEIKILVRISCILGWLEER